MYVTFEQRLWVPQLGREKILANRLLGAKLLGTNVIRIDVLHVEAGIINTNYYSLTELEVEFRHGIISKCRPMLHW